MTIVPPGHPFYFLTQNRNNSQKHLSQNGYGADCHHPGCFLRLFSSIHLILLPYTCHNPHTRKQGNPEARPPLHSWAEVLHEFLDSYINLWPCGEEAVTTKASPGRKWSRKSYFKCPGDMLSKVLSDMTSPQYHPPRSHPAK